MISYVNHETSTARTGTPGSNVRGEFFPPFIIYVPPLLEEEDEEESSKMVSMEYISSEVASAGASRAIILSRICPPSSLSLCLLCLLRVDEIVFVREAAKKRVTLSSFS